VAEGKPETEVEVAADEGPDATEAGPSTDGEPDGK
jgi:hypothetical protein